MNIGKNSFSLKNISDITIKIVHRMKNFISITIITILSSTCYGQIIGGEFEKLSSLYVEGKYEDCGMKALRYTENDKYRKHPEPYLYLAMSFYQLSESEDQKIIEYYPKALKDAMKWAAKFKKKDTQNDYYTKNSKFIEKLKMKAVKIGDDFFAQNNYRKASYYYKAIVKFANDPNVMFMSGICDIKMRSVSQATLSINGAIKELNSTYESGDYNPNSTTSYELSRGMIIYSDYLVELGKVDSAKATMSLARKLLPSDEPVRVHFGKLLE